MKNFFIATCALALLNSCGNQTAETPVASTEKTATTDTNAAQINDLNVFKFQTVIANMPSPLEIVNMLPKSGFKFDKNLINPSENEPNYLTSYKRSINYGVYIVDLVYLTTNEQFSHIQNYFNTTRNLAKSLDAAESFDKVLGSRMQNTIENKDTISKIIDQLYVECDKYLRSNDRVQTATEIITGSWIESQYITVNLIKDAERNKENEPIFNKIFEQKLHAANLASLLKEYEKDKDFKPLIEKINEIVQLYAEVKTSTDVSKEFLTKLGDKLSALRRDAVK